MYVVQRLGKEFRVKINESSPMADAKIMADFQQAQKQKQAN